MRTDQELLNEIDDQIEILVNKGINPRILVLGDFAHFQLKTIDSKNSEYGVLPNSVIKTYKDLEVIVKFKLYNGVHDSDSNRIKVYGD